MTVRSRGLAFTGVCTRAAHHRSGLGVLLQKLGEIIDTTGLFAAAAVGRRLSQR